MDTLTAQDGLYTLAIRDAEPCYRVIGAHRRCLGPAQGAQTAALFADPAVRLVITMTEKVITLVFDPTV